MSPYNPVFNQQIAKVQTALTPQMGSMAAHDQAYGLTYQTLLQQSASSVLCGPVSIVSDCLPALYPAGLSLQKTRPVTRPRRSGRCTLIQDSEFRIQDSE